MKTKQIKITLTGKIIPGDRGFRQIPLNIAGEHDAQLLENGNVIFEIELGHGGSLQMELTPVHFARVPEERDIMDMNDDELEEMINHFESRGWGEVNRVALATF